MDLFSPTIDGFRADLYLATLSEVAKADGLQGVEKDLLAQQAAALDLSLDGLPAVPEDLTHLPWATRVLVYRDSLMLALADGEVPSTQEQAYLDTLATRLGLPGQTVADVRKWIGDYSALLQTLDRITKSPSEA